MKKLVCKNCRRRTLIRRRCKLGLINPKFDCGCYLQQLWKLWPDALPWRDLIEEGKRYREEEGMSRYICIAWELKECPVGDLLRLEDGEEPVECVRKFFKSILQEDDPKYEYDDEDVGDYCASKEVEYFIVEPVVAERLLKVTAPNWGSLSTEDFDIACHSMMLYICSEFSVGEPIALYL